MSDPVEPYVPYPSKPEEIGGIAGFWRWRPVYKGPNRQQIRASKRLSCPKTAQARTPVMALCNELWAWSVTNYPGKIRMTAFVAGLERSTAEQWVKGAKLPGAESGARLAGWIRAKAERLMAIADEIERVTGKPKVRGRRPGKAFKARSATEGLLRAKRSPGTLGDVSSAQAEAEGLPARPAAPYLAETVLPAGAQALGSGREGQRPVPFLPPKV